MLNQDNHAVRFVVCIDNRKFPASLKTRKIYEVLPDEQAARCRNLRVVDESGRDYLYPAAIFVPIELPQDALRIFERVA